MVGNDRRSKHPRRVRHSCRNAFRCSVNRGPLGTVTGVRRWLPPFEAASGMPPVVQTRIGRRVTSKDHQFSIRFVVAGIAVFAAYLGLARLLVVLAVIGLGLLFFLFWFALSFFLLTRPPELDPTLRKRSGSKLSLRWRLVASCAVGMAISLLVMIWATRQR